MHAQVTNLDLQLPLGYRLEAHIGQRLNVSLAQPERVALGNIFDA